MNKRQSYIIFIFIVIATPVFAAMSKGVDGAARDTGVTTAGDSSIAMTTDHFLDIGAGIGYDYGGFIGVQVGYLPISRLSFFVALAWMYHSMGWNTGWKVYLFPENSENIIRMNLKAMYGANGAGSENDSMGHYLGDIVFLNFTLGMGFGFRFGQKKNNGFDFDLDFPIRGPKYNVYIRNNTNSDYSPWPVIFSLGFHHEF
jgi:hypothetical protein